VQGTVEALLVDAQALQRRVAVLDELSRDELRPGVGLALLAFPRHLFVAVALAHHRRHHRDSLVVDGVVIFPHRLLRPSHPP